MQLCNNPLDGFGFVKNLISYQTLKIQKHNANFVINVFYLELDI
jgi:hypothetical protein